ncbi:MAG TPA: (d)CMP kinase [Anaerolineales bacterium]|nr:(d)CMP kinase [Anaerolineales bacterium]
MPTPSIIAIDGPAASGKTTLARLLAERLGYLFVDTGAMYRAVTLAALERGVPVDDQPAVEGIAEGLAIDIRPPSASDGRFYDVLADGADVTWGLRSRQVDAHVSQVSAYPGVRRAMTRRQREIGLRGRVVMVGRDIGTVVLPEADLKLYVDASLEERAKRRHRELVERGETADLHAIESAMAERDRYDSSRTLAPLRPAEDARILNTTDIGVEQAVERALALARGEA